MARLYYIIICFVLFFGLLTGCKMSEPNIKEDYVGMTSLEKNMQFEYDKCCYAQQYTKIDFRCDNILKRNGKVKIINIYNMLKENKKLPIIYRKAGSEEMTFDDFFKYIK